MSIKIKIKKHGCYFKYSFETRTVTIPISKGKAVPLQAWGDPEGPRKLRFLYFITMAQDGGKVMSLMHWPHLPPGNTAGTHFR
jgi:hypothetical protein